MADKPAQMVSPYPVPVPGTEHVELADYVNILWRRRWLIALGTVVSGVTAFIISLFQPPVYEASARVLVSQSKVIDQSGVPATTTIGMFQALLQNRALAAQVIAEVGLDKAPYNLTPEEFVTQSITIEEVPRSNLLRIDVKAREPKLAANAANRLSLNAVAFNRTMNQGDTAYVRDFLKAQLDEAREKMEQLNAALLAYKEQHQVELRRSDADSMLRQRGDLLSLSVEIETEHARLARAEEELAKREKVLSIPRVGEVGGGLIAAEHARADLQSTGAPAAKPPDDAALVGALDLRHEFINPVYEVLEYQVAASRMKLAALDQRRNELVSKRGFNAGKMQSLTDLYQTEDELGRLELEASLARTLYSDLSKRYDQSRLQVASRTSELQLFDPALPPERRLAPRPLRNAALAMSAACLLLVLVVFLAEYFAEMPVVDKQPQYRR